MSIYIQARLFTHRGGVSVRDLYCEHLHALTDDGAVLLANAHGDVAVTSATGDVDIGERSYRCSRLCETNFIG